MLDSASVHNEHMMTAPSAKGAAKDPDVSELLTLPF